jgi:alternative ribosome-rescue factor
LSKKKHRNQAKSLIAQPFFRCRQEKPGKGKGSYRRQASLNWEACSFQTA